MNERSILSTVGGGGNQWVKLGLAVAAMAAYVLAFVPPFRPEQADIVQLAATPVVVFAWLFGFWGGTAAAVVMIPLNAFLFALASGETFAAVVRAEDDLLPAILLLVLGAVLGGLRDIADQMRREFIARAELEEARRESEERYRFVAESASDGIVALDQDRTILFANRAAEKIFGRGITDLIGQPFRSLLPERQRDAQDAALRQYLESVVTSNPGYALQIVATGREGRDVALEVSFGEYVQDHRHVFTGVIRDVTERKHLEQVLKRSKEEAERANRAKSEFLSRMSHELRTPLNAILGFAQLMEMDAEAPEERESVEQILRAGRHLLSLVDEVLDIARIEAGRLTLSLEPVDADDVLSEAWALVRHAAERAGIRLERDLSPGPDVRIHADRQRLKQILVNLLSNAVKYNREGGTVTVRFAPNPSEPGRLRLSVTDTGDGIQPEMLPRLFRPFDRLGAEQTAIEGTGIGLALSRGLVEAMGGRIGADSRPGQGSTFFVDLPLASRADPTGPHGSGVDGGGTTSLTHPALVDAAGPTHATVLYIEDNPSNVRLLERVLLRRPGVRLLTAAHGADGLQLAREETPDVILLDMHLPDMHGEEILRRIRSDPILSRIPVVILSADVTGSQVRRMLDAGARAYLPKPLDVAEFLDLLEDILVPA